MWLMLVLACSDYGLETRLPVSELEPDPSTDPGTELDDPVDPLVPGDSEIDDSPDPDQPPVDHEAETSLDADCDSAFVAEFSDGEIWVGDNGSAPDEGVGILISPEAGWFDLYNTHIVESGASQHNESAYFHVQNASNPDGRPSSGNCGDEWVVADGDNDGPPVGNQTFLGTFWFDEGENTLVMRHYCELVEVCPQFHVTDPSSQTCGNGNINSVHFMGFAVCLMPL